MPHPSPTPIRRSALPFLAAALLLASSGAGAVRAASPAIQLSNGREPIDLLFVGGHLAAGLSGGDPNLSYRFELRDAGGLVIAGADIATDAAGNVPPVAVWAHTGVVGCDFGVVPDPAHYRFQTFTDAEDALGGSTLQLVALDGDGLEVATAAVPILAVERELVYFSDNDGCLRHHYPSDEDVFLAFYHPNRAVLGRAIYLVSEPPAGTPAIGAPLSDVRSFKPPQHFVIPTSGNLVLAKIWASYSTSPGNFVGVVRSESEVAPPPPVLLVMDEDYLIGPFGGTSTTGLSVGVNGCSCIDPPDH